MDTILIVNACIFFLLFLGAQKLVLKISNKLTSYYWLVISAILLSFLNCVITGMYLWIMDYTLLNILFVSFISLITTILLLGFYLLTFYSYCESSITIKLLSLIAEHKNGISIHQLDNIYNKEKIINRRLNRLTIQHAIEQDADIYRLNKIPYVFTIRRLIQSSISFLFPKKH